MSTESTDPPLSAGMPTSNALAPHPMPAAEIVAELRRIVEDGAPPSSASEHLLKLTESLFPGPIHLERTCDPEDPQHEFAVLTVNFAGEPQEAVRRRRIWHAQAASIPGCSIGALRLSVVSPVALPPLSVPG